MSRTLPPWHVVIRLGVAAVLLTAFVVAAARPPIHESTFSMMVGFRPKEPLQLDVQRTTQLVRTHSELLRSAPVLEGVLITLARSGGDAVVASSPLAPAQAMHEANRAALIARLQEAIRVTSPPFTNLIVVTVRDREHDEAFRIATALASSYPGWWARLMSIDDVVVISPPSRPVPSAIGLRSWLAVSGTVLVLLASVWPRRRTVPAEP